MTRRGLWVLLAAAARMLAFAAQLDESSQCYGIVPELHNDTAAIATAEMKAATLLGKLPEWLAYDCKQSLRNFVCLTQYGPVVEMEDGETFAKCTSVCDHTADVCKDFLKGPGAPLAAMVNLESCADTAGCVAGNYDILYEDDLPQCPKPLVVPDRPNPTLPIDGTACAMPCLSFMYSKDEWDIFISTLKFFSYFGFSAGIYMIFASGYSLYTAEEERKVGAFFVWLFSVGCSLSAIGSVILVLSGVKSHLCEGNAKATLDTDSVCVTQGYLYLIGTLMVMVSAVCQCLDLYLRVVLNVRKVTLRWFQHVYIGLMVVFVLGPVILVAATNKMGYEPNLSMASCFIMNNDDSWVSYTASYAPSTLGNACIIFMMAHCLVKINGVFYQNRDSVANTDQLSVRGMQKFIRYNIRPILFIILVGFTGLLPAAVKYYYEDQSNIIKHSSTKFMQCVMRVGTTNPENAEHECGEVPHDRPSYKVLLSTIFITCAYGMLPLLIYGLKYPECAALKKWSSTSHNTPGVSSSGKRAVGSSVGVIHTSTGSATIATTGVEMSDVHDNEETKSPRTPKSPNSPMPDAEAV